MRIVIHWRLYWDPPSFKETTKVPSSSQEAKADVNEKFDIGMKQPVWWLMMSLGLLSGVAFKELNLSCCIGKTL